MAALTALDGVEWYYVGPADEQVGPASVKTLVAETSSGAITRETLVWAEHLDDWRTLANVSELRHVLFESDNRNSSAASRTATYQGATSPAVFRQGHEDVGTRLGAPAERPKNARDAVSTTSFLTGSGLVRHDAPKKDARSTAKFRGTWTPQIRNPSNVYAFAGIKPAVQQAPAPIRVPDPELEPEPEPEPVVEQQPEPEPESERGSEPEAGAVAAPELSHKIAARVCLLISTYGDAYHATQRRLQNMLDAHIGSGNYEVVDGGLTHLPDMKARRNELFKLSGLRGKYPQLFVDSHFVGSFDEVNDINEGGELKEMLAWQLQRPPSKEAGTVIAQFYAAKHGAGAGVQVDMNQFDALVGQSGR